MTYMRLSNSFVIKLFVITSVGSRFMHIPACVHCTWASKGSLIKRPQCDRQAS